MTGNGRIGKRELEINELEMEELEKKGSTALS